VNRREQLIQQLRYALGQIQNPSLFDYDETLVFEIGDMEFEFSEEQLEDSI